MPDRPAVVAVGQPARDLDAGMGSRGARVQRRETVASTAPVAARTTQSPGDRAASGTRRPPRFSITADSCACTGSKSSGCTDTVGAACSSTSAASASCTTPTIASGRAASAARTVWRASVTARSITCSAMARSAPPSCSA